jgi:type II secretory pathway pseudopilin PulG
MIEGNNEKGFSLVEVIIASIVMVVLCVAALSAFSYASSVNRGNNLRSQSLSALQEEIELYRGFRFKRSGTDSDERLNAGTYDRGIR